MRRLKLQWVFAGGIVTSFLLLSIARAGGDFFIYAPVAFHNEAPTATPTSTKTPTPTVPGPTPTKTPTTTPPPSTTGDIEIIDIFFDGSGSDEPDEHVEIENVDTKSIQVQGWTLRDEANHVFTFPAFVMAPGKVCRIYTNQNQPAWCSFNYGSSSAIWNNTGDCATLKNANSLTVDEYCYP